MRDVGKNLDRDGKDGDNKEKKGEEVQGEEDPRDVKAYNELMEEVDRFLTAPDRTKGEIDFKAEVEKYLDLIEEPSNAKPTPAAQKKKTAAKAKKVVPSEDKAKRPKKLIDVSLWNDFNKQQQQQEAPGPRRSPSPPRDNKYVADLRNKLLQELDGPRRGDGDGPHVASAGTSAIKRTYERLNQKEEVALLGAREGFRTRGGKIVETLRKKTYIKNLY